MKDNVRIGLIDWKLVNKRNMRSINEVNFGVEISTYASITPITNTAKLFWMEIHDVLKRNPLQDSKSTKRMIAYPSEEVSEAEMKVRIVKIDPS